MYQFYNCYCYNNFAHFICCWLLCISEVLRLRDVKGFYMHVLDRV